MKVQLIFEAHDCLPSKLVDSLKRAIASILELHGIPPSIDTNRDREMEAYQAFFRWNENRLAEDERKGPSET